MIDHTLAVLFPVHVLSALVWVGGMFFAHMALRPAVATVLQPPERLKLLAMVLARFFLWVKLSIVLLFLTGVWILYIYGSFAKVGWPIHTMILIAIIMTIIFGIIYAGPFKAMRMAVSMQQWPAAGAAMGTVRKLIGINLILGLITVVIGVGARFWI